MVCGRGGLYGIRRGGKTFGGLGLQGHPYGSSVRNSFEGSINKEGTGSGNAIFEGGFKFAASEAKKFDSTASEDQGVIGELLGGDWGASKHWWSMIKKK